MGGKGVRPVIEGDEVMARLAAACPSWAARNPVAAAAPLEGSRDFEPVAAFAHHLVDLAEQQQTDELPAVFATVEDILADGDADAISLVRTGLIEEVQNIASHRDVVVEPSVLRDFAGPSTAAVWDEIDGAWSAAAADPDARVRPRAEEFLDLAPTERRRIQSMTRELPDGTLAAPSDVLRYEAGQYDAELGRWLHVMRRGWLLLVVVLLLVVIVAMVVR